MLEEAQKVTGVPVWHLEHFCPGLPVVLASMGMRIDYQPVAYPSTTIQWLWPVFRLPAMRDRVAINARESSTVPLLPNTSASRMESAGGSGSRSTFVRDLLAGTYTFFQTDLTRVEVDRIARSRGSQLLINGPRVLDEGRRGNHAGRNSLHLEGARKLYKPLPSYHTATSSTEPSSIAYRVTEVKLLGGATISLGHICGSRDVLDAPGGHTADLSGSTYILLRPRLPK
ncbi:hypothetical protein EDD15DRAFT_2534641 [Pisolithus albus]|nr:hypothetical protein EDD15DRAFT_2534641 [Pisolithus albus]